MFSLYTFVIPFFSLTFLILCVQAHPSEHNKENKRDLENFQKLLDQVDQLALHEALHTFSPKEFKHGMFPEDRTAVEVIHKEEPSIATSIVNMARRQKSEIVDLVKRQDEINNGTAATTTAAPVDAQSTSTRVTPVPLQPETPTSASPTADATTSSAVDTPVTTTPASTSSTAVSTPISTSPTTSVAPEATSTSTPNAPSTASTNAISLTAGQVVTTTNGFGLVVISTVGGGATTITPTAMMTTSTNTVRAAAQTSVVVQTSTLPDGSQSVVTAVTVVGGGNQAADTPTGTAGVGSTSPSSSPGLQTGEAVLTRGWGKEMVLVVGGAVAFAGMM